MKKYAGLIIILILAAVIFAPVNVPFTIESVAKAMPVRQWVMLKTQDGTLSATLHDHLTGLVKEAEGYQFDRGDMVNIKFNGGWTAGANISAGETVATITSNRLNEKLVNLRNQLIIEKANLGVVQTGQKEELIRQLEEQINLAKEDLKLRRKVLDRTKGLYEEGIVSLTDLEQAENQYYESEARVKVAVEALQVAGTGEKKETISLANSKITSLEKDIDFLEQTRSLYSITAPFDGLVRFETTLQGDRLLLEDTSAMLLLIPIRLKDIQYIKAGQQIRLQIVDSEQTIDSEVLQVSDRIELVGREQVVIVRAIVREKTNRLPTGMPMRCRINCGDVRIKEFLKRSIKWQ